MKEVKNKYKGIPNCLRKYRKTSGYTQKQVARFLGVRNTGMISRWEKGSRIPNYLNILRLAELYHTMSEALYSDLRLVVRQEIQGKREEREGGQKQPAYGRR